MERKEQSDKPLIARPSPVTREPTNWHGAALNMVKIGAQTEADPRLDWLFRQVRKHAPQQSSAVILVHNLDFDKDSELTLFINTRDAIRDTLIEQHPEFADNPLADFKMFEFLPAIIHHDSPHVEMNHYDPLYRELTDPVYCMQRYGIPTPPPPEEWIHHGSRQFRPMFEPVDYIHPVFRVGSNYPDASAHGSVVRSWLSAPLYRLIQEAWERGKPRSSSGREEFEKEEFEKVAERFVRDSTTPHFTFFHVWMERNTDVNREEFDNTGLYVPTVQEATLRYIIDHFDVAYMVGLFLNREEVPILALGPSAKPINAEAAVFTAPVPLLKSNVYSEHVENRKLSVRASKTIKFSIPYPRMVSDHAYYLTKGIYPFMAGRVDDKDVDVTDMWTHSNSCSLHFREDLSLILRYVSLFYYHKRFIIPLLPADSARAMIPVEHPVLKSLCATPEYRRICRGRAPPEYKLGSVMNQDAGHLSDIRDLVRQIIVDQHAINKFNLLMQARARSIINPAASLSLAVQRMKETSHYPNPKPPGPGWIKEHELADIQRATEAFEKMSARFERSGNFQQNWIPVRPPAGTALPLKNLDTSAPFDSSTRRRSLWSPSRGSRTPSPDNDADELEPSTPPRSKQSRMDRDKPIMHSPTTMEMKYEETGITPASSNLRDVTESVPRERRERNEQLLMPSSRPAMRATEPPVELDFDDISMLRRSLATSEQVASPLRQLDVYPAQFRGNVDPFDPARGRLAELDAYGLLSGNDRVLSYPELWWDNAKYDDDFIVYYAQRGFEGTGSMMNAIEQYREEHTYQAKAASAGLSPEQYRDKLDKLDKAKLEIRYNLLREVDPAFVKREHVFAELVARDAKADVPSDWLGDDVPAGWEASDTIPPEELKKMEEEEERERMRSLISPSRPIRPPWPGAARSPSEEEMFQQREQKELDRRRFAEEKRRESGLAPRSPIKATITRVRPADVSGMQVRASDRSPVAISASSSSASAASPMRTGPRIKPGAITPMHMSGARGSGRLAPGSEESKARGKGTASASIHQPSAYNITNAEMAQIMTQRNRFLSEYDRQVREEEQRLGLAGIEDVKVSIPLREKIRLQAEDIRNEFDMDREGILDVLHRIHSAQLASKLRNEEFAVAADFDLGPSWDEVEQEFNNLYPLEESPM